MTFDQMAHYEPELKILERRVAAIRAFAKFLREADFQDIEEIRGPKQNLSLETYCFCEVEARIYRHLLSLVGPSAMHPKLKEADHFTTAHRRVMHNFPRCFPDEDCASKKEREVVRVDFS